MSSFKLKDSELSYRLFRHVILIHMLQSPKKYFLYKLVLLVVHIRLEHEQVDLDEDNCNSPVDS